MENLSSQAKQVDWIFKSEKKRKTEKNKEPKQMLRVDVYAVEKQKNVSQVKSMKKPLVTVPRENKE